MNIEFIGQIVFSQEVQANGKVWVVKGRYENIYALELDAQGFSLPVWSARERAEEFLENVQVVGREYEPYPIGLDSFIDNYIMNEIMGINELLINMDGTTPQALVLTLDEFRHSHDVKKAM